MSPYIERQAKRRLSVAVEVAPHAYHSLGKSGLGMLTVLKDAEPSIAFSTGFTKEGRFMPVDEFRRVYAHRLAKAMQEMPS